VHVYSFIRSHVSSVSDCTNNEPIEAVMSLLQWKEIYRKPCAWRQIARRQWLSNKWKNSEIQPSLSVFSVLPSSFKTSAFLWYVTPNDWVEIYR